MLSSPVSFFYLLSYQKKSSEKAFNQISLISKIFKNSLDTKRGTPAGVPHTIDLFFMCFK